MPLSDIDAYLRQSQAEFAATLAAVPTMNTGETYRTGFGGEATVNMLQFVQGTTDEQAIAHTAKVQWAVLTQDGRHAVTNEWHDGAPTSDEWVYVERWDADGGRVFHGYVDAESRKLLQTG